MILDLPETYLDEKKREKEKWIISRAYKMRGNAQREVTTRYWKCIRYPVSRKFKERRSSSVFTELWVPHEKRRLGHEEFHFYRIEIRSRRSRCPQSMASDATGVLFVSRRNSANRNTTGLKYRLLLEQSRADISVGVY